MSRKLCLFCAAFLCFVSWFGQQDLTAQQAATTPAPGAQQQTARDILGENLFAPDLILQHASAIGLQDDQKERIESTVQRVRDQLPGHQEDLQSEMAILGEQLGIDSNDEQTIMTQLDKVLAKEQDIKRLQIGLLVRIREQLSIEQRQALQNVKQQLVAQQQALQQRIQEKVKRVQQGLQQRAAAQQSPPQAVIRAMQNFQKLAQQNDVRGAEAALDEALLQLQIAPVTP